jgi:hypothetical protein
VDEKLRVLTVVDQHTRECVALEAGSHFRGQDVAAILTRVGFTRGRAGVGAAPSRTQSKGRCLRLGAVVLGMSRAEVV